MGVAAAVTIAMVVAMAMAMALIVAAGEGIFQTGYTEPKVALVHSRAWTSWCAPGMAHHLQTAATDIGCSGRRRRGTPMEAPTTDSLNIGC